MRFNLQLTYWCLVSITIISSCFLFLVVASESSGWNAGGAVAEDAVANAVDGGPGDGDASASASAGGVNVNSKHVNANKFVKIAAKESSASRIEAKAIHSLPIVHVVEVPSSPLTPSKAAGAEVKGEAPSPAEYKSDEEKLLVSDDGSVLSDAVVVPISEGNALQLEAPQVRVLQEEAPVDGSTSSSSSSSREDVSVNAVTIGTSIDATSLPDISSENPTVIPLNEITSTDLPLGGGLEQHTLDPVIISKPESSSINQTRDGGDDAKTTEDDQKDDQIEKINDSGGSIPPQPPDSDEATVTDRYIPSPMATKASTNATNTHEVNLTAEEVPIPVFSEWAQKQMEAAEKQQLEQDVVNSSAQKKNLTTGSKPPSGKLRTKNYASPDCGAKIIASNSDAQNTGAVLTSSKDEYMLSPCTNRIWFVVELCEAIQAETIDLANFELFSSSPKNFTVAVSNRFPTRDWSNVGRFIADDKRTIQSFDLHPHLFGKFVRADIHSHYNSEHFCPVSLFRVYGTSEFEAFETEDRDADDIDEYDDEVAFDQTHQKNENNLFKSASDAVLSIVKKAAEVLVKTNSNRTTMESKSEQGCFTPSTGDFVCTQCKDTTLAAKVNYVLSCRNSQLMSLLEIERLRNDILTSQICAKRFSVNLDSHLDCKSSSNSGLDEKSSYYLSLLSDDYVGALCQLLAGAEKKSLNDSVDVGSDAEQSGEISLNLTIDKSNGGAFGTLEKLPEITEEIKRKPKDVDAKEEISPQIPPPPRKEEDVITSTERAETVPSTVETLDINIYNLGEINTEKVVVIEVPPVETVTSDEQKSEEPASEMLPPSKVDVELPPKASATTNSAENDPSSWDNLDTLLSEGVGTGTLPGMGGGNHGNQQKIPSGPHSESVFIRLNNRIKALERNMSLSGQYLEELSRRYKKQVEELQLSLTKTVRALEDQNRRHSEQERVLLERNALLKDELDDVSLKVHACIILIIFVGSFMILLTVLGVVFYRSMARSLSSDDKHTEKRKATQKKLNRRKSFDDFSDASTGKQKIRRPSEEAMLILKDCAAENSAPESEVSSSKVRQRKISVFYGRKTNRKGEKRSWPEVTQPGEFNPGVEDLPPAEPTAASVLEDEEYDKFNASESDSICTSDLPPTNGKSSSKKLSNFFNGKSGKKSKKANPTYKRQESAPADICSTRQNTTDPFDEKVILDEDDIENFIPGADLAYNEFMPDGPSGYQITDAIKPEETRKNGKKSRRLSSPAFFKSPFGKSSKKSPPHEPTSWEWYRSKKSSFSTTSSQHPQIGGNSKTSSKVNGFGSAPSPASSLSEILPNSGQGSSDNSFRILEEAINTSTTATSSSSNGNSGGGSNSGSSAGSGRSSKKNRSFNRIFKKVF